MAHPPKPEIVFSPDLRMRNLSEGMLDTALVAFDADSSGHREKLRLRLNVALNGVTIRQKGLLFGGARRKHRYIGCRSVQVEVNATRGRVVDYTPEQPIEVKVQNSTTATRTLKARVAPEFSLSSGETKAEVKVGEAGAEAARESGSSASYANSENVLNPVQLYSSVKWELVQPIGEKVIQHFITGNLNLFADCHWPSGNAVGKISVVPLDVEYFNSARRPMGVFSRLAMEYHLWKETKRPLFLDGVTVDFHENRGSV